MSGRVWRGVECVEALIFEAHPGSLTFNRMIAYSSDFRPR